MNPVECLAFALAQPEWQAALGAAALLGAASLYLYTQARSSDWRLRGLYGSALGFNAFAAFGLSTITCVLFLTACNTNFMTVAALALPLTGALTLGFTYLYGHRALALAYGAKPLSNPVLSEMVRRASEAAGLEAPNLYCIDAGEVRAFSSSGRVNALFLSVGALEALSREELRAVLAHELEHLRNGDPLRKLAVRLSLAPHFICSRVVREHEQRANGASNGKALALALQHFASKVSD